MIWTGGVISVTLVQPAEGPEPQIRALEHPSRKSPSTSLDPSHRVTGETDTSWSPWTSPSGQKFRCPQPWCIESGRHPGDQLLQPGMTRDLQWQRPKLWIQADVGPGVTGVSKTRTPLHPQVDSKVKYYTNTIEEHLRNMVSRHRDWEDRLHKFQVAYWVSTYETTSMTPANMCSGGHFACPATCRHAGKACTSSPGLTWSTGFSGIPGQR